MEIKNFIKIYDAVLPWNVLSNLIRFANISNFEEAKIGGGEKNKTDFNIRRTYTLYLNNLDNSLSNVHWCNLLYNYLLVCYLSIFYIININWNNNNALLFI